MHRRKFLIGLGSAAIAVVARPVLAAPSWSRDAKDPRWVQGQVVATSGADDVWSKLRNVSEWPHMFTDIKTMKILERSPDHWRLEMQTRTFDCGPHQYHVRFDEGRSGRMWIDAPGVSAIAYVRILPVVDRPEISRAVYSLFIDVRAPASWFISEADVRKKQEQMVTRYLADLERLFAAPAA